jgi:tRNA pseudouridine-54 N-methylase
MMGRRFLVLFDSFPIEEGQVRSGENIPEVIVACRCVNVALFVSGNLRRDVSISIAWGDPSDLWVVTFPGETIKRVSPDERSISFFLLKASQKMKDLFPGQNAIMDNGIEVTRANLDDLVKDWKPSGVYLALERTKDSDFEKTGLFVYGMGRHERPEVTKFAALPRPPNPERFILDMNVISDRE